MYRRKLRYVNIVAHRWRLINERLVNIVAHRWQLINERLVNLLPYHFGRAIFIGRCMMEYKEGYVYHIKDDFLSKVNDDKLMSLSRERCSIL